MTATIYIDRGDTEGIEITVESDALPRVSPIAPHYIDPDEPERIDITARLGGIPITITPAELERAEDAIREAAEKEEREHEPEY